MDKLTKHLKGLSKEADKMLQSIPIPEGATNEQKQLLNEAKKSFDLSGDLRQKQQQLNNLFHAITNNR